MLVSISPGPSQEFRSVVQTYFFFHFELPGMIFQKYVYDTALISPLWVISDNNITLKEIRLHDIPAHIREIGLGEI